MRPPHEEEPKATRPDRKDTRLLGVHVQEACTANSRCRPLRLPRRGPCSARKPCHQPKDRAMRTAMVAD